MDVSWIGSPNYSSGNYGRLYIVPHIMEGWMPGTDSVFQDTNRQTSAHWGVDGSTVHQYVSEDDTAWHCGNSWYNWRSLSLEMAGTTDNPPSYETLDTTAEIMASMSQKWFGGAQLVLGENVMLHKWLSSTSCPATADIDYLISKANQWLSGSPKQDIADADASIDNQAYTGDALAPAVHCDADFDVAYSDNVSVGWATATLTGTGDWEGTKSVRFAILPASLVGYSDIDPVAWYVDSVNAAVERNIMTGYSAVTWGAADYLTRGSAVCAIANAAGFRADTPPFSDVSAPYYYEAAKWATNKGWLKGADGKLLPETQIARQDLCVMLHRYAGEPSGALEPNGYTDWVACAGYAQPAVAWAVQQGIIGGDKLLRPTEPALRVEGAAMICKAIA